MGKQKHAWVKIRKVAKADDFADAPIIWLWKCSNCQAETWTQGDSYPGKADEDNSGSGPCCPPTAWDRIAEPKG